MREEPAFLLLPPFIAESGHTQAARLTTNCQTDISSVWCTCSLLLWALFLLFFAQFGFQHIFSLITYQVSFHLASWWPHLFHFSFHLSFSRLLKMQQFPNNSCVCCGAVHPTPETQVSSVSYFTALHWRKRQTCPHWTRQTFSTWPITYSVQE